jgi:Putative motility protein
MDVSAIAGLATSLAQTGVQQQVGVTVLRKALDIESSTAATLIAALPPVNLPSNLGNSVNTTA